MAAPKVVIERLPKYVQALAALDLQDREVVSSEELSTMLGASHAQIRKDLSYFGRFGKQGRGYAVRLLLDELRRILGLNRQWKMALVGVGRLGQGILGYKGFSSQGFRFVEAFDSDSDLIGQQMDGLVVKDSRLLEQTLHESPVEIGVVAVPAEAAQEVVDALVRCGIRAILNYAPMEARAPDSVEVRRVDPVLALQEMTYYLRARAGLTGRG